MNKASQKPGITSWRKYKHLAESDSQEVLSLEDIPDFDSVEAEVHWWRHHRLSQQALDEIPQDDDQE